MPFFYNALQQSDFDVDLSAACKAFETMMFQYTDDMLERSTDLEKESSGAYAGEASVIYVYEVLYKITGKQNIRICRKTLQNFRVCIESR